ncbi:unnamed protein product [Phytophthora fragariaefolia]|uniref:Unnamed protein product n=1 Tax=Phytophthora fragariaefolia TaxID=1490495 RepID=A0A9W6TYC5_9STRA|nr:unnamed protein product [Phytophthora fragariaefolia]
MLNEDTTHRTGAPSILIITHFSLLSPRLNGELPGATSSTVGPSVRLIFLKDTKQFGVWKDLIIGHLRQKSAALRREAMVKGQDEPAFSYEDLLQSSCEVPRPIDSEDETLNRKYKWQQVILNDQDTYTRTLLSQTLPRSYLESLRVSFNDERLPAAWKRLETVFGQSNAQGMATLIAEFDDALAKDFESVGQLILRVKAARNRINRQSREALGNVTMIPNQYAAIKVLSLFPSQYWGNHVDYTSGGFQLDRIEALLRNVFMNKSRIQIEAMQAAAVPANHVRAAKHLGKRKARSSEGKKRDECFYCEGEGKFRTNIFVKAKAVNVAHVKKGQGTKKKGKLTRSEIPVDMAHVKPVGKPKTVATVQAARAKSGPLNTEALTPEQAKADEDELMGSPPPGSPVVSDSEMSDDDDVDDFDPTGVQALAGKVSEASGKIEAGSKAIEETVRTLYPELLRRDGTDISQCDWVLDSGCGYGLTANASLFVSKKLSQEFRFTFGEGSKLSNTHIGSVKLYFLGPDGIQPFYFDNMALVPKAKANILSEYWLKKTGYQIVESVRGGYKFVLWKQKLAFVAVAVNGAYYIQARTLRERQIYCSAVMAKPTRPLRVLGYTHIKAAFMEWHVKLGHLNRDKLIEVMSGNLIPGLPSFRRVALTKLPFFCHTCTEMKMRRISYRNMVGTRDTQPISTIHMDTNGPMKTLGVYGTVGSIRYFLSIIDDQTSWRWTYVLRKKTEVHTKVKELFAQLEREGKFTIRRIRSDGGTEFVNMALKTFCTQNGITFQTSNAYSPGENGAADRDHQTKMGKVRCALRDAEMAAKWWPEALKYMTYVQNCTPMSRLKNRTPYELVKGVHPDVKTLQVRGCVCFAYVPEAVRKDKKLSARAIKCRFLGISEDTKGYRLLDIYYNTFILARSVTFDTENCSSIITRSFGKVPEKLTTEELQEIESLRLPLSTDMNDPQATQINPDRITGTVGATRKKGQLPVAVGAKRRCKQDIAATVISRPQRIRKTPVRYSDYKCYQTHIDNAIAVDAKVNRIGVPKSIRDALTGAHRKQWRQALDLEYQSLLENGTWKLTRLPYGHKALPCHWVLAIKYNADGSVERFKARLVAQGNHQEYGVNCDDVYAPVARFESLRLVLAIGTILDCHIHQMDVSTAFLNGSMEGEHMVLGFVRCNKEYCIYVQNVGESWIIVVVYVDDLTIMSKDIRLINQLKRDLSARFKMKDLGEIHYILKMEVRRNRKDKTMTISQHKYIKELLNKFDMEKCVPVSSPQIRGIELQAETDMSAQQIAAQKFDYRGLVGSLQYLVRSTRPDIANAVRELSKFLSCYNKTHWEAARRVLKYLKGTSTYGLLLDGKSRTVTYEVYTDASFACQPKERKSVTGYVITMAGTMQVWCDSKSAISTVKNPGNHKATKHVQVRYLFARDLVEEGRLDIHYCPTDDMAADILTKALPPTQFSKLRELIGVKDLKTTTGDT